MRPETRYARSGEIGIAYQVTGEGDMDLVIAFPFLSHVDLLWDSPAMAHFVRRLGSFARVILFDRRGVGLSDPAGGAPTLEERMDDVRAVMDAAGSERAALLGMSEGATMCMLFAATYPERISALVLWGAMARSTEAEDYPWAPSKDALVEANEELIAPFWGQGSTIEIFSPSLAADQRAREFQARFERQAASPMRVFELFRMFLDTDVRDALQLIQTPTLVLQRRGDHAVNYRAARWLAGQIDGSRYIELEGEDHFPWVGDSDAALGPIEEFLTGVRPSPAPERVLATVLFTDIVDSTRLATEMGDRRWRALLEEHHDLVRERLERFEGREIKTTGDGFLAIFAGPTRAAECARAIADAMPSLGIEVRAGLHSGEVELIGEDVGGIAVHVAARIAALAGSREVLASRTVRDLAAGSGVDFEAPRPPRAEGRRRRVGDLQRRCQSTFGRHCCLTQRPRGRPLRLRVHSGRRPRSTSPASPWPGWVPGRAAAGLPDQTALCLHVRKTRDDMDQPVHQAHNCPDACSGQQQPDDDDQRSHSPAQIHCGLIVGTGSRYRNGSSLLRSVWGLERCRADLPRPARPGEMVAGQRGRRST